jgi:predicted transcriptional regulator
MPSDKSRVLVRTSPEIKAALEKLAARQDRSVSYILNQAAIALLEQNGYMPKPAKRKAK